MDEQPRWLVETKWILSSVLTWLAILVVFWTLVGIWGTSLASDATSQNGSYGVATDRTGNVLTLAIIMPLVASIFLLWYVVAGVVSCRLLVPTFAALPPRTVGVACTTWAIGIGALSVYSDPLAKVLFTACGVAWGLLMPLPRKTALDYGPLAGGAIVGLGLTATSWTQGGLTVAVIWTAWRLYRRHSLEVTVTAACAAVLPAILVLHDLGSVGNELATQMTTIQIVVLVALAVAGAVMALRTRRSGEAAPTNTVEANPES
jgi:hypothetical protein